MRHINIIFLTAVFSLATIHVTAQEEYSDIRKGNRSFKNKNFTESEIQYRKALSKNGNSFEANFNLGNSLYRQGKYKEAAEQFSKASTLASRTQDKSKLASVLHNVGNSLFEQNDYSKALEAYKASLKLNPKDNDTRYNMALANALLKAQEQNKDQKQNQNNQNQDKKQDQQNKQQPKQNQQQQQQKKPMINNTPFQDQDLEEKVMTLRT